MVLGQHDYNERNFFFLPAVISPCGAHTQRPCASSSTLSPSGPLGRTVEPVTRSSLTSTCTFAFRVYGLGFMLHSARLAQPPRGGRGSDCSGGGLEVLPVAGMAGLDSSMTCILPLRILLPLRPWSAGPQQKPGQGRRESGRVEARDGEKEGAFGLCAFVRVCARLCTFVSVSPPGPTTVTYH